MSRAALSRGGCDEHADPLASAGPDRLARRSRDGQGSADPPRRGRRRPLYLFSSACTMVALVCLWMLLQMLVLGRLSEARAQHLLYTEYRTELATETAPTGALDYDGRPVAAGSPVALMSIPRIGLHEVVVVDGTASGDLLDGPGHRRTTPLPGNVGTSVVMGRSTTYGAPVRRRSPRSRPATRSTVLGAQGSRHLRRQGRTARRRPAPAVADGAKAGRLTLVTADGHGRPAPRCTRATWSTSTPTPRRPTPPGRSTRRCPTAEQAMQHGTTSALPLLVLLLALVAGLVLGGDRRPSPRPRCARLAGGSTGRDRAGLGGDRPGDAPPAEPDVTASDDEATPRSGEQSDVCPQDQRQAGTGHRGRLRPGTSPRWLPANADTVPGQDNVPGTYTLGTTVIGVGSDTIQWVDDKLSADYDATTPAVTWANFDACVGNTTPARRPGGQPRRLRLPLRRRQHGHQGRRASATRASSTRRPPVALAAERLG